MVKPPPPPPPPRYHQTASSNSKPPQPPPPPPPPYPSSQQTWDAETKPEQSSGIDKWLDEYFSSPLFLDFLGASLDNNESNIPSGLMSSSTCWVDDEALGHPRLNRKPQHSDKDTCKDSRVPYNEQMSILHPRRYKILGVLLRTLNISHQEIHSALLEGGRDLSPPILRILTRTVPTKEEEKLMLSFTGNPSNLVDVESFLYHLLRDVPSPFERLNAMLFKFNYELEIIRTKQSLQTLELACKEMETLPRSVFFKLLEVIRTIRGINTAHAFDLTQLCDLSGGKTTLLHLAVEEVLLSEGRRLCGYCVNNQNQLDSTGAIEKRTTECCMKLGFRVVWELTTLEFAEVRNAAHIDYEDLASACSSLGMRVKEIGAFLKTCNSDGFVTEMKEFLELADGELRVVKEEQGRIMELVNRTTEYYQVEVGASKEKGSKHLKLFVIVRDFLGMVDNVILEIMTDLQQQKLKKRMDGFMDSSSSSTGGYGK